MNAGQRFEHYMEHLAGGLGHMDRHAGLKGYCTGLMLPLSRKSVEPMAARVDPLHASARHQSLHHFVAKAEWSDDEMLRRVAQWVVPKMDLSDGGFWIIDDTGFPKKGKHSVGVARQYCGVLGKQDNCHVLAQRAASDGPRWTRAVEDRSASILEKITSKLGRGIWCLANLVYRGGSADVRDGTSRNSSSLASPVSLSSGRSRAGVGPRQADRRDQERDDQ